MKRKRNQRKKKAIDDGEGEEEDRISRLPDSILHKILSSMDDLVSAIETCALSKRYNNSNLCRFYFSSDYFVDQCLVKKRICYAVCHNVQALHVGAFCFPTPYEFPRCFINCETYESKIVISTPRLTSFKFQGNASPVCCPASFPCLDHVYVDLHPHFHWSHFDSTVKERMPFNLINTVGQLREAKSVTLSLSTLELRNLADTAAVKSQLECTLLPKNYMSSGTCNITLGHMPPLFTTFLTMVPDSLRSHPPFRKLKHLQLTQEGSSLSLSLPLNVINYLTQGSSCAFIMKNGTPELLLKRLKQMLELNSATRSLTDGCKVNGG
ncbi:unnamed protein product [Camellia sinensis]